MGDLGTKIMTPRSPEEKAAALVEAALRPETFKKVFDYYKGKKFPEAQFFVNTLVREFDVIDSQAQAFSDIFTANMKYVGLVRGTTSGDWLSEALPTPTGPTAATGEDPLTEPEQDNDASIIIPASILNAGQSVQEPMKTKRPNKLFIGHGKNKKPLEQLTKTLRELGIPHVVAEDEPNAARPIPQKVRETMEQCGAAVLIFSADVEYHDADGGSIWRPSENVSHELGAASVMYDNRVILFKEESISLASNFSGIGYIPFEKDKLDAKTNELLRELIALKILKVSVDDD
jgi:predicted nucleotide-binding protein